MYRCRGGDGDLRFGERPTAILLIWGDGSGDARVAIDQVGLPLPGGEATVLVVWERTSLALPAAMIPLQQEPHVSK